MRSFSLNVSVFRSKMAKVSVMMRMLESERETGIEVGRSDLFLPGLVAD